MTALIVALFLAVTPAVVAAAPPDVMTIVRQMKEVFEPARPSTRKVVISMSAEGEKIQWVAGQARKEFPDGKRMVMVMLDPPGVRGMAYLIAEPKNKPTRIWAYSPAIRRVRSLVPVDAYEHFLGTDFTYADLGFVRLHEKYRLLGEEDHAGVHAYKVEEQVPQERAYYSRLITWVAVDSMLPLQRDYYDGAGELWKTEIFEQVSVIDGVPTPLRIRMNDVQEHSGTELNVSEVRYGVDIPPDAVFDPKRLPQVATHSLWRGYSSHATQTN
ncbi:MAG TPA: outer membrane lipoprotein-sorting protein [Candidatus Binatia bacterium]|nr:outer membrane lipoprotein-sorting protein [Candidatus Binatia bacterium]